MSLLCAEAKNPQSLAAVRVSACSGGEGGIRTRVGILSQTRFPDERFLFPKPCIGALFRGQVYILIFYRATIGPIHFSAGCYGNHRKERVLASHRYR